MMQRTLICDFSVYIIEYICTIIINILYLYFIAKFTLWLKIQITEYLVKMNTSISTLAIST